MAEEEKKTDEDARVEMACHSFALSGDVKRMKEVNEEYAKLLDEAIPPDDSVAFKDEYEAAGQRSPKRLVKKRTDVMARLGTLYGSFNDEDGAAAAAGAPEESSGEMALHAEFGPGDAAPMHLFVEVPASGRRGPRTYDTVPGDEVRFRAGGVEEGADYQPPSERSMVPGRRIRTVKVRGPTNHQLELMKKARKGRTKRPRDP